MTMNGRRFLPALAITLTLAMGILIGSLISRGVRAAKVTPANADAKLLPAPSPMELSNSFAKIADSLQPAVVNINTESTVRVSRRRYQTPDNSPFDDFFDRFFHFEVPDGPTGDLRQQSLGSGVILDKNGYILTNHHVIMQSGEEKPVDRISVYLHGNDHDKYKAKIIGEDKLTDLAVIKIEPGKPLAVAQLGDSDSMRVGDWVLAIGSPFTLEGTVTAGIISAKGRQGRDVGEPGLEGQFKTFIQTDAAINPGNSGGPLVNLAGQVIGINTAIATRRGGYDGVGFAIPSNTARKIYNSIVATGGVRRGAIGVNFFGDKNPALLRTFTVDHGIVINDVEAGSPAERAGLKRGDVILSVEGQEIRSGDELVQIVSESEIGKKLKVEYLRDGKRMTTQIEVGDRNKIVGEVTGSVGRGEGKEPSEGGGILGLSVQNLTHDEAQKLADELHLDSQEGVLVMDVKPGGFASDLGVQPRDVLLSIDRHPVRSIEDFNHLEAQLKSGTDVQVLIARRTSQRKFTTLFLADRLP